MADVAERAVIIDNLRMLRLAAARTCNSLLDIIAPYRRELNGATPSSEGDNSRISPSRRRWLTARRPSIDAAKAKQMIALLMIFIRGRAKCSAASASVGVAERLSSHAWRRPLAELMRRSLAQF